MARLDYHVERMDCASRVDDVLRLVSRLPGARLLTADAHTGRLSLELDEQQVPRTTLENNLLLLGYRARALSTLPPPTAPALREEPPDDEVHQVAGRGRAERGDALPGPIPRRPGGAPRVLGPGAQAEHARRGFRTRWRVLAVLAVLVLLVLVCEGSTWVAGRGHLL